MQTALFSQKEQEILNLDLRKKIYDLVKKFSGCNFHSLKRESNFSSGTLQYHLNYLTRHGLIKIQKDGNKTRYFTKEITTENKRLLMLLRQDNIRTILLFILTKKECFQRDIINFIKLSPSTVSWYLAKLLKWNVIQMKIKDEKVCYSLSVKETEIISLLIAYKKSFLDNLVDKTIEMWNFNVKKGRKRENQLPL